MTCLVLLFALTQDATELVDRLKDESIDVRDDAGRRLVDLGARALPALWKSSKKAEEPVHRARAKE